MVLDQDRIIKVNIAEEMRSSYIDYSMSVIVSRALPDVRDGLKPVHRRILYSMLEQGNTSDKAYRKSARTVGDVMGKYHPHGDSSIYGSLVRMAQDWAMRYPLVDGQGNFGSIDGDSPAAMRYTEARLEKMGEEMMTDLNKETVDFQPNYDDKDMEPTVLSTRIPNLLVNGATGIAVGMATNMPTHNLREVIDGCVAYIDNPEITTEELMQYVKGPDFPTGAYIYGLSGVKEAYETGRGRVVMRAKTEIESTPTHDKIIVNEIPYNVNKRELIEYIARLVTEKKIEGISNVNDESDKDGMRIVIDLKRDANSGVVLNKLFKMTQLQFAFNVNAVALVHGRPKVLSLKDCIRHFCEHRHDVTIRRTMFDLRKAKERAHILEGLIIASDNIDEVVHIIKTAKTPADAIQGLMDRFALDEIQAKAIVDMRLRQLTGLMQEQLRGEYDELMKQIEYLQSILDDDNLCRKIMKDELIEVKEKYGDDRRTEIVPAAEDFNPEDFYADDEMVITISHCGYIKRTPLAEFRSQSRGGIGIKGSDTKDEDFIEHIYNTTNHNYMLFFTEKGRCYWLKVYNIPEGTRQSKGRAIQNILNLDADNKVTSYINVRDLSDEEFVNSHYLIFLTKNGTVKKTRLKAYSRPRQLGVNAINLVEGDSVVSVGLTNGNQEIVIGSRNGRAVRFNESDVRAMGRTSTGVRGIRLVEDDDEAVGMFAVNDAAAETILVVSENGYGKRSIIEDYRLTRRGTRGVMNIRVTEKTGKVAAIMLVTDEHDLMIINKSGTTIRIRMSDLRVMGRATQGVRLINLERRGDTIASVCRVDTDPEEEAETIDESDVIMSSEEDLALLEKDAANAENEVVEDAPEEEELNSEEE
ncbi:MAG: DNA gyrase subunit A [Bacteroidaceae bacterium]|nr:DNA gyrase subunit A [Bacteroidaceae bacterium]MBR5963936.1 DNA gyrase subunit A [Bacteroidaceae bacterium]